MSGLCKLGVSSIVFSRNLCSYNYVSISSSNLSLHYDVILTNTVPANTQKVHVYKYCAIVLYIHMKTRILQYVYTLITQTQ